MAVFLFCQF